MGSESGKASNESFLMFISDMANQTQVSKEFNVVQMLSTTSDKGMLPFPGAYQGVGCQSLA